MDLRAMKDLLGPWLADIAANFLAVVIIVLVVISQMSHSERPAPAPQTLNARPVTGLSGADAVEALRIRLLHDLRARTLDLTPEPPELTATLSPPLTLLVLSPDHYHTATDSLQARGMMWQELTVPQALKTAQNNWDPAFLALAPLAPDSDLFIEALRLLLTENAEVNAQNAMAAIAGNAAPPETPNAPPKTLAQRALDWLRTARDIAALLGIALVIWGMRRLHRWSTAA